MTTIADPSRPADSREPAPGDEPSSPRQELRPRGSLGQDLLNGLRGFCMGVADTVPGVSGGTVALILGHYDRLVAAIRHVDGEALRSLLDRRLRDVADHVDLRFLVALLIGIGAGIVSLAGVMHELMHHHMNETMAVFFGLVLASVWVVRRNVRRWTAGSVAAMAVGVMVALAISQIPAARGTVGHVYLFLSASVAICAMILPGISGAFVLLLLGVYEPVIGMIKNLAHGEIGLDVVTRLSVFALGCACGLVAFSRLLHHLLRHHRDTTMASLIGLMIGSVGRLWPLQAVTPETAGLELKFQQHQWVSPSAYEGNVWALAGWALAAAIAVVVIDAYASKLDTHRADD